MLEKYILISYYLIPKPKAKRILTQKPLSSSSSLLHYRWDHIYIVVHVKSYREIHATAPPACINTYNILDRLMLCMCIFIFAICATCFGERSSPFQCNAREERESRLASSTHKMQATYTCYALSHRSAMLLLLRLLRPAKSCMVYKRRGSSIRRHHSAIESRPATYNSNTHKSQSRHRFQFQHIDTIWITFKHTNRLSRLSRGLHRGTPESVQ